eukprot:gnl/Trimastix_PCT/573.p1 GENE.gnl/Trimastix_PCT/573~~gnl/Trimastix_PCT/573.p1  ORF type:complete len:670 (-),score=214.48 gnl/Trimastix_PCT/573:905-2914(-)
MSDIRGSRRSVATTKNLEDKFEDLQNLREDNARLKNRLRLANTQLTRIRDDVVTAGSDQRQFQRAVHTAQYGELETRIEELERNNEKLAQKNQLLRIKSQGPTQVKKSHPFLSWQSRTRNLGTRRRGRAPTTRRASPAPRTPSPRVSPSPPPSAARSRASTPPPPSPASMAPPSPAPALAALQEENAQLRAALETAAQQTQYWAQPVQDPPLLAQLNTDIREKAAQISVLKARFERAEKAHNTLQANHQHALEQLEDAHLALQEERTRYLKLKEDYDMSRLTQGNLKEAQIMIDQLTHEKKDLEIENSRILELADAAQKELDATQAHAITQRDRQIAQLQEYLKEQDSELTKARMDADAAQAEASVLREAQSKSVITIGELRDNLQVAQSRLKFFSIETAADDELMALLEQAMGAARKYRDAGHTGPFKIIPEDESADITHAHHTLCQQHISLSDQHKRVLQLLDNQKHINESLESTNSALRDELAIHKQRIAEAAQLRDQERAAHQVEIDRLKQRIHDRRADAIGALDEALHLGEGENLVKITVGASQLSHAAFAPDATTFVAVDFYEHETQVTPIAAGHLPDYAFVARYRVQSDAFLLHYLAVHTVPIQLFEVDGMNPVLKAVGELPLEALAKNPAFRSPHSLSCLVLFNNVEERREDDAGPVPELG